VVHLVAWLRTGARTLAGWCSRLRRGDGHAGTGSVTVLGGPYPGRSPALAELARRDLAVALAEAGLRPTFPATQAIPSRDVRPGEGVIVLFPPAPRPR
jgi:hypothetical protein